MKLSKTFAAIAACFLLSSLFGSALAQTASLIRVTETFNWAVPSPDPTGVVFVAGANALFITDSEVEETALFNGSNMFQTELDGSVLELFSTLGFTSEPTGITINPDNNHLFISMDDSPRRIFEIDPGSDGLYLNSDDTITSFRTTDFNCYDAEGVTYNPVDGVLHIACGVANIIYTIDPGPNQLFDGVAPVGDDTVSSFDTSSLGLNDPEGIAYDSISGALYVTGKPKSQLLHVTTDGQFIRTVTLDSSLLYKPSGLALGPSSLENGAQSLYVVDRGVDNDHNPAENDGRLFEFALPSQTSNEAPTIQISAPVDGDNYQTGDSISFVASATDPEDGDLSSTVTWQSDIDGTFGSGAAFSTSSLSIGLHAITASCIDSSLAQSLDVIQIRVLPEDTIIVEARIDSSSDDAEQRGPGGNTWINGKDLELIYDNSVAQIIGLRFNALAIPAGAVIEDAYIQFQADEAQSSPVLMEIRAQASDDAEPIQGRKNNLTDRSTTAASSIWQPDNWLVIGEAGLKQKTANLSAVVQEVVNRPGWSDGNSMAFLITGSNATRRTAVSFDGEPAVAPLLRVRYTLSPELPVLAITSPLDGTQSDDESLVSLSATATDPQEGDLAAQVNWTSDLDGTLGTGNTSVILTQGLHTITATVSDAAGNTVTDSVTVQIDSVVTPGTVIVEARIDSSSDDAEQRGPGGNTWINGNDLELIYDNSVAQIIGLRFNALAIPAGAVIEDAYIQFQADEAQSSPVLMEIRAQASDDAEPIQGRKNNLTDRSTTIASSTWEPAAWQVVGEADVNHRTSDLSALVQEVVNRPGWSDGNSMAFLITGTSTTRRTAESFDSEPAAAPLLHVRYSSAAKASILALDSVVKGKSLTSATSDNLVATTGDNTAGDTGESMIELTAPLPTLAMMTPLEGTQFDDESYASDPEVTTLRVRVNHESDDAEEHSDGLMVLGSRILELSVDGNQYQQIGLRFNDVQIPRDAGILSAFVQFQAAGTSDELAFLTLTAQDSDNPEDFKDSDYNISSRPRTAASVNWFPPAWSTVSSAGPDQQTPNLNTLVQKVVTRDSWVAGNSIVILLEGDGKRLAEALEGQSDAAPELTVSYTTQNVAPSVNSGIDQHIALSDSAVLNGSVLDDGLPAVPGYVDLQWTVGTGPGSVIFSDPTSLATNASFNSAGTYQLLLTATDGQLTAFDEVTIHVGLTDR